MGESSSLQLAFNFLAAVGACTGPVSLLMGLADRRIRLRLELGFADALVANGLCVTFTLFNDGRDVLLDDVGVSSSGELPPEVEKAIAERFRTAPRPASTGGKGTLIARGDKFAGQIPWAWGVFLSTKTPFYFNVTLRNGWSWSIPGNLIARTRFSGFRIQQPLCLPFGKPKLRGQPPKSPRSS